MAFAPSNSCSAGTHQRCERINCGGYVHGGKQLETVKHVAGHRRDEVVVQNATCGCEGSSGVQQLNQMSQCSTSDKCETRKKSE